MSELTQAEKIEMKAKEREYHRSGRPEMAAKVKEHVAKGELFYAEDFEDKPVELPDQPPVAGPNSTKKAWIEYARAVSDLDEEIIESVARNDLIRMLYANGFVTDVGSLDSDSGAKSKAGDGVDDHDDGDDDGDGDGDGG